ncbi:nucleoside recognition GATE domain-containing membrane protein YjiH [Halobacillus karajensis]|uniref:Sporulation integral membrane protein YlbJ n=1 Tax=Halobacillus karajensis TaxID=195088 RepID=A0A024P3T5_9BACI|nr:YjiH family protein [Halobacillus karajensis]CDQ18763.1 sporulation integral membrane protein YlbJ [Halobacillus karajensis]CDQ23165.1 sporulation integral membrane protein YlbJ [Halobacillus karajensis]CDQ26647.1 sporulation integral membrane protein YlbJ [Halobacillus karajensis]SEH46554.1 nucleoside recognition GATE domain-containing membrane protein YjiH [Halobacillus karajensis]
MKAKDFNASSHLKFIIPSLIGIFLFMFPITGENDAITIPIAVLAGWVETRLADYLSLIMMIIISITSIGTILVKLAGKNALKGSPFFQSLFNVPPVWVVTRILGMIFAIMVYFQIGPEAITSEDTGGLLLDSLLHVLFAVFLFAGLFLPLLLNYGLLELFGVILTKIMRPLFRLPGRSSIDSLASWLGDGTIGVLLTSKQYEEGYYTKREAAVIGTTFSVVSITFSLVVIQEVGLGDMFGQFYLTVALAGFVAALIMPRIPPLSRKADTYVTEEPKEQNEEVPEQHNLFTYGYTKAVERGSKASGVSNFLKQGGQNILDMWMGVAPIVMALGTIALVIAEFTPFFTWIGMPFIPFLELMQVPYAQEASETILVGFADMFLPAIIGSSIESEMTRFIIASLSVTQLIYMSEVGGLLLGSKVPVNIKDLFIIFLLRTIITLPIITLIAHLLF